MDKNNTQRRICDREPKKEELHSLPENLENECIIKDIEKERKHLNIKILICLYINTFVCFYHIIFIYI